MKNVSYDLRDHFGHQIHLYLAKHPQVIIIKVVY